jgi:DNA repair exonuclease SbcCD nuclease subunit
MRLVGFSDLHLDSPFAWAPAEIGRSRRQVLRTALSEVAGLARELDADALLCAGDLYEQERWTPDTANFVRRTFADLAPIPVFVAPGNHDWMGPASLYATTEWTDNVHIFAEPHLTAVPLGDVLLWGAAHVEPAGTPGFLEGFEVAGPGIHIGLFHGSERSGLAAQGGDKQLHAPFTTDELATSGLAHALVGHYHRPSTTRLHTYAGAAAPLAFGEGGGGAVVLDVDASGSVDATCHRLHTSDLHDFEVDVTGAGDSDEVLGRVLAVTSTVQGVGRVTLVGELDPDVGLSVGAVGDARGGLEHLVVRAGGLRHAYDIDSLKRESSVQGRFVQAVMATDFCDDDERHRVLATGLRALDGRADLEVV